MIWDEIGESDADRDNILLQLEQECLDIYHRKVEETRKHKADMYQWLEDAEAQAANIVSSLGESILLPRVGLVRLTTPFCAVVNRNLNVVYDVLCFFLCIVVIENVTLAYIEDQLFGFLMLLR